MKAHIEIVIKAYVSIDGGLVRHSRYLAHKVYQELEPFKLKLALDAEIRKTEEEVIAKAKEIMAP